MRGWYARAQSRLPISHESLSVSTRSIYPPRGGGKNALPVLLIQGLGGNALLWKPQMPALPGRFRVYAEEVIGQMGKSANTWLP
jgi:pimeloyl-ACP methyl ester carboxylesterase